LNYNGGDLYLNGTNYYISDQSMRFGLDRTNNDAVYEWQGWYSGSTRQAILIWDGSWDDCATSSIVCFKAEDGHDLSLKASGGQVRIKDTLFEVDKDINGWVAQFIDRTPVSAGESGIKIWLHANSSYPSNPDLAYDNIFSVYRHSSNDYEGALVAWPDKFGLVNNSDRRLKEDIVGFDGALDIIDEINVVDYNFIGRTARHTGFIAQDLYESWPDAVVVGGEDPKTNPWQVDYAAVTPLLMRGVQELKSQMDGLEVQIQALEDENSALESRLEALEATSR
jgi:hypothetical protein